jgi:hypothetical protein
MIEHMNYANYFDVNSSFYVIVCVEVPDFRLLMPSHAK